MEQENGGRSFLCVYTIAGIPVDPVHPLIMSCGNDHKHDALKCIVQQL